MTASDQHHLALLQGGNVPQFGGSTFDEHLEMWRLVDTSLAQHQWALAAIAASLATKYGDRDMRRFASEAGVSVTYLYELAQTHRAFRGAPLVESPGLKFSHYKVAARSDDPAAALEAAVTHEWTVRELHAHVHGRPEGTQVVATAEELQALHEEVASLKEQLARLTVDAGQPLGVGTKSSAYFRFVASKPCCRCGSSPVEVAHLQGGISPKTGLVLPRRSGVANVIAIPLCAACHRTAQDSVHNVGEEAFNTALGRGQHFVWMLSASLLAEFYLEAMPWA